MESVKWFDRKFHFDHKENIFPLILERLKGTPVRITHRINTIPTQWLTVRLDNRWSIEENLGHLTDLEPLWQQRLDDIVSGKEYLRPADLTNAKTDQANHNTKSAEDLLEDFSVIRNQTMAMIEDIGEEIIFRSSLHPRLKTPMRTMDLFLFVAEHDDHHLARMTAITNQLRKSG
jgi:uncharacterized damage-inducible protein DinB